MNSAAPGWRASRSPIVAASAAAAGQISTIVPGGDNGASFFDEMVEGTRLLRPQVEEALAELVALGLVNSDSFAGRGSKGMA